VGTIAIGLPFLTTLATALTILTLGVMILLQWPFSGFWVIGLFVGIDLLFSGWTWIMLALRLKSLPKARSATMA
jgi:uncharacterized membrane protein HdeD (DUF308 family)